MSSFKSNTANPHNRDIGAQCGARGCSSQTSCQTNCVNHANHVKLCQTVLKIKTVASILKTPRKPVKSVTFAGGSYTKVYYSFEPVSQLNHPYQRPADFYFPRRRAREHIPWVEPIKVPYTIGPFGVQKEIPDPRIRGKGRAQVLGDKVQELRRYPHWGGAPIPGGLVCYSRWEQV